MSPAPETVFPTVPIRFVVTTVVETSVENVKQGKFAIPVANALPIAAAELLTISANARTTIQLPSHAKAEN